MGCCQSSIVAQTNPEKLHSQQSHLQSLAQPPPFVGNSPDPIDVPSFSELPLSELTAATNNFSSDLIISENGDNSPNVVYKGQLPNKTWIAVKKFLTINWPDPEQFKDEAMAVGRLRHRRLFNLIGFCCDGDERLLVAEYIPNNTLAKRLFLWEDQTMEWAMRLRVALYVAEALDYCNSQGRPLYHGLNAYRVLFDKDGDPRLSCFGLMKYVEDGERDDEEIYRKTSGVVLTYPPQPHLKKEKVTPKKVIYDFGALLLELLSGKNIPPNHGLDIIQGKKISQIMDPHLEGQYSTEEATVVVNLASQCLQDEPTNRPKIKVLVETLSLLQKKTDVPSSVMLGMKNQNESQLSQHRPLSSLGEASSRKDLTAIHQILVTAHYRDDERSSELSFQEWTEQMRDMLEARKRGDYAFRDKKFSTAIEYYSQFIKAGGTMVSPTVFARRSLCFLFSDEPHAALRDAMQAQIVSPDWPTAFYMQSVALAKLEMHKDAADMLNEASALEEKRQPGARS